MLTFRTPPIIDNCFGFDSYIVALSGRNTMDPDSKTKNGKLCRGYKNQGRKHSVSNPFCGKTVR